VCVCVCVCVLFLAVSFCHLLTVVKLYNHDSFYNKYQFQLIESSVMDTLLYFNSHKFCLHTDRKVTVFEKKAQVREIVTEHTSSKYIVGKQDD